MERLLESRGCTVLVKSYYIRRIAKMKKNYRIILSSLAVVIGICLLASPAYSGYSYQRSIVIDSTKVGADNSGSLPATGFPVLVSLSDNWLKTTTADPVNGRIESANGWDIIFKQNESTLYHEIESYDGTTGTLVAWVRVDSLSKAADTTIDMFYGDDSVASATEDPANVWDDNFVGVWHLSETDIDGDAGDIKDSTSYGHNERLVEVLILMGTMIGL